MTVLAFCGEGTAMPAISPGPTDVPLPEGNVLRMWRVRG